MKKLIRIGIFSVALAQSLYGVDATQWWQLDKANNTNPPPAQPTITNPLTIYENSTLNITTIGTPTNGGQFYGGSILFNNNLTINLKVDQKEVIDATTSLTSIYRIIGGATNTFSGTGSLRLVVNGTQGSGQQIFDIRRNGAGNATSLTIGVKTNISATEGSQIFSILRNAGGTINFTNDLIVDLSKATGVLDNGNPNNQGITDTKAIFDNTENGTINVNLGANPNTIVQLTGDIATYANAITNINLTNSNSFFKGKLELHGGPMNINLSGGSNAKLDIYTRNTTVQIALDANRSSLYADFFYINNTQPRSSITLSNAGTWYMSQDNTIQTLTITNPKTDLTKENFKNLTNLSAVDFRFSNKGDNLRTTTTLEEATRYTLTTGSIGGENGVFRLFGVFNRGGWTALNDPATGDLQETIATDQIIATDQVFSTNYIQLFWNANNFDKSMLNTNLENQKIIVAKQNSLVAAGNFVGAITPIGVYNYITNLKKEMYDSDDDGTLDGFQWIVSDVQRADNSYLSRLLDSLFQSQFRIQKTQIDTLNLRMGELRKIDRVHGVWIRSKYGRLGSKETSQTTASWDEYASIWLGYDQNFYVLGGKNFLGLAFDVNFFNSNGIPDEDDFSNPSYLGQSQSYGLSVYDTYFFNSGFYIDALVKYYLTYNKFIINSEVLAGNTPKFFSHGLYGSLEIGQRFNLPLHFYIKPDAGFSFAFNSGQDWNFMDWSNQLIKARLDFNAPLNLRTGLTAGWTFNHRGYEGDLYIGTSFEYDFNTGGDLRLEDFLDKMTLTHAGNFNWRINMGTNIILNEYWRIYFDVDTAFFGTINSTFTLNGGVRITFGRLHPQMPYIPPRFEGAEDLRKYPAYRRTIPEVQNYETQNILDNYKGMTKIRRYPPKINVQSKPFNQSIAPNAENLQNLSITPKVEQTPKGEPTFIDNPQMIEAPTKNYKREQNMPISPTVIPQQERSLQNIKEDLGRGYQ